MLSVRLPGYPLAMLRKVQANDVARLLHDITERDLTPDLIRA